MKMSMRFQHLSCKLLLPGLSAISCLHSVLQSKEVEIRCVADKIKHNETPYIANDEGKPCVLLGEEPRYKRRKPSDGPIEPAQEALPIAAAEEPEELPALGCAPVIEPGERPALGCAPVIEPEELPALWRGPLADLAGDVEDEPLAEGWEEGDEDVDGEPWEEGVNDGTEEVQQEDVLLGETPEARGEAIRALKAAVCLSSDEEPTSALPVPPHDNACDAAELIMFEHPAPACKNTFTECRQEGSLAMSVLRINLVGE